MAKRILELSEIRELLRDRKLNMVAREAGVGYRALLRMMNKEKSKPTYELIEKLSDYLEKKK